MTLTRVKTAGAVLLLVLATGLLSACDENEQGRVLRYEKGKYLGPEDQPLTEQEVEELRQRATRQGG